MNALRGAGSGITTVERGRPIAGLAYYLLCLFLGSSAAQAAWETDSQFRLDNDYNDNPTMANSNKDDSAINVAHGQAELRRVTENSQVSAIAAVNYINYVDPHESGSDLNDKDTEYADVRASWTGERLTGGLNGSLRRDVLLRTIGFVRSPLPGDTTGTGGTATVDNGPPLPGDNADAFAVDRQIRRYYSYASPFVNYALSERTTSELEYHYFGLHYDRGGEAGLENSQTNGVTARLRRAMSEADSLSLSVAAARFDPETNPKVDSYELTAGWRRSWTELAGVNIDAGVSFADPQNGQTNKGFVLRVRGFRRTEVGNFFVQAGRELVPSGFGLVETDRLNFGLERVLSDTVRVSINSSAYRSDSSDFNGGNSNNGRKFVSVGPQLTWSLTPSYSVGATYRYTWLDRQDEPGGAASGNSVGVFISYQPKREF